MQNPCCTGLMQIKSPLLLWTHFDKQNLQLISDKMADPTGKPCSYSHSAPSKCVMWLFCSKLRRAKSLPQSRNFCLSQCIQVHHVHLGTVRPSASKAVKGYSDCNGRTFMPISEEDQRPRWEFSYSMPSIRYDTIGQTIVKLAGR